MGFESPPPPGVELYPTPARSAYGRARHVLCCQAHSTRHRQCRRYAVDIVGGTPLCRIHKEVAAMNKKTPCTVMTEAYHTVATGARLVVTGDKYDLWLARQDGEAVLAKKAATDVEIRTYVEALVTLITVGLPKVKRTRRKKDQRAAA